MRFWTFCLCLVGMCVSFDLNDPKTNLDSVVRTTGSTDPRVETVNYINGTVFMRLSGGTLQKLFLLEGFNIARKEPTSFGYLSLSREFLVYRDYRTGHILDVFMNSLSRSPNEVFSIRNNPVNRNLTYGPITPFTILTNDRVGFNEDILLQYPNVLDPKHYPKFTAGPTYEADELFQFYTSYSQLATTKIQDLNYTSTWGRRAQFLPWMELGTNECHMFYISTNWKCLHGLLDISIDILEIIKNKYPEFLHAPTTYEVPNETSWTVFKAVIDQRRKEGKPDIILPDVNVVKGLRNKNHALDPRVYESLAALGHFNVRFTGRVYSEITGKKSIYLFKVKGDLSTVIFLTPDGPQIVVNCTGSYLDPKTEQVLQRWKNPLTNQTIYVPPFRGSYVKVLKRGDDSVWSLPVPHLGETAVVAYDSFATFNNATGEIWGVNLLNVFFTDADITANKPYFYGSWLKFSTWSDWMQMPGYPGSMVWRMNVELIRNN